MTNFITIDQNTRFESLAAHIKNNAPFVMIAFWDKVKKNDDLDCIHFDANFNNCQPSWGTLYLILQETMADFLSASAVELIEEAQANTILNYEVAQASQLEPHEEQQQWQYWEKIDAIQDAQDRIDLYRNEY